jgi:hypothetical protein
MLVFPTRAVPLKDDSADTRSGWQAMPVAKQNWRSQERFSDVFGRYTMECLIDGPQSFKDCAKGDLAASYFPTGCTT